ncbi:glycerophosphoryl diester phosphodiesterase [Cyclonatronum proteinivorum]|uniref:Glycerophosphoryl diester phosphodiesterase n=1 Tax=Cyclonatronum proteinivorum TaxID=1457365 RepID=A0A345UNB5_9BACT|nr:glycerophosphodiester phosphodiesterase family protein [Cyclonatronum proteinivorum]AXJ01967.1 glycerophosphoryl diester phosphodiesterase [Cyclonatronum proteinivorum]
MPTVFRSFVFPVIFAVLVAGLAGCESESEAPQDEAQRSDDHTQPHQFRAMANFPEFDLQGHRGARGILPENTIPSLLVALDFPITTLEFDVVVSADSLIVLSHEPWFHHDISSHPDGRPVLPEEALGLNMFEMTYEEISRFDVGLRGNSRFPEQEPMAASKPLMRDAILAVEAHKADSGRDLVFYNIETKSHPSGYNRYTPEPQVFAELLYRELEGLGVLDRVFIQSFDVATLQAMREIDATLPLVLLVENERGLDWNLEQLGFIPEVYSPDFRLIDADLVQRVHAKGMRMVPWTINEKDDMLRMVSLGVDGLITDYPNRATEALGM